MKLVKSAESHATQVAVSHSHWVDERVGKLRFRTCVIDFEEQQFILGDKIDRLDFGTHIYHGVLPLKNDHGSSIVECWVDNVEEK